MTSNTPIPYDTTDKQLFRRTIEQVPAPVISLTINNVDLCVRTIIKHGVSNSWKM